MGPVEAKPLVATADLVCVAGAWHAALVIVHQLRSLVAPVAAVALDAPFDAKVAVAEVINAQRLASLDRHGLRHLAVFPEGPEPLEEVGIAAKVLVSPHGPRRRRRRAKEVEGTAANIAAAGLRRRARARLAAEAGAPFPEVGLGHIVAAPTRVAVLEREVGIAARRDAELGACLVSHVSCAGRACSVQGRARQAPVLEAAVVVELGHGAGSAVGAGTVAVAAAEEELAARVDGAIREVRPALAVAVAAVAEYGTASVAVDAAACAVRGVTVHDWRGGRRRGRELGAVSRETVVNAAERWSRAALPGHAAAFAPGAAAFPVAMVGAAQSVDCVSLAVAVAFVAYTNSTVGTVE